MSWGNYLRMLAAVAAAVALAACGGGGGGGGSGGNPTGNAPNPSPAGPTLSFSASSSQINAGSNVTLTWSTTNVDTCTASGDWNGNVQTSGSTTVGPIQADASFVLSCSGSSGGVMKEVAVVVGAAGAVQLSLEVDRDVINANEQVTLTWSSSGADTCTADGGWNGQQDLSGQFTSGPLSANTTYELTCTQGSDSAVAMVSVEIANLRLAWQAPTENQDGSALTDLTSFNVYWGADSRDYDGSISLGQNIREWNIDLPSGDYYIAVTAVDADGDESGYSNEVFRRVP